MPKRIPVGPSWTEVFIGAFLSLVIGAALGATYLVLKPAVGLRSPLKEEERKPGTIYYMEGSRDGNKGRGSELKRKQFAQGASVTVNEDDINLAVPQQKAPSAPASAPKAGEKVETPTATAVVSPPNFRIREGVVQLATPIKVNVMGVDSTIVILSKGTFVKKDDVWAFEPQSISAGSCPLDRLPVVKTLVYDKFIGSYPVPEDIATSWRKLVAVHVEGSELKLTMPQ